MVRCSTGSTRARSGRPSPTPPPSKWVTYQGAVVIKNIFVDNGDGTISLHTWAGGLQEMIKQSGGPPLEGSTRVRFDGSSVRTGFRRLGPTRAGSTRSASS